MPSIARFTTLFDKSSQMEKKSTIRTRALEAAAAFLGARPPTKRRYLQHVIYLRDKTRDEAIRATCYRQTHVRGGVTVDYVDHTFRVRGKGVRVNCMSAERGAELRQDDEVTIFVDGQACGTYTVESTCEPFGIENFEAI